MTRSSCRPGRVDAFGKTATAIGEGLVTRAGKLDPWLDTYVRECEEQYRCPTAGTVEAIRTWAQRYRALGAWTDKVAQEFMDAGAGNLYMTLPSSQLADPVTLDDVMRVDDSDLDISIPSGTSTNEFCHRGLPPRPDDPYVKKWLLGLGLPVDYASQVSDGTKIGKWLGIMGMGLTVFSAADYQQDNDADTYLSDSNRAWRVVVQSASQLGGSAAGSVLGGMLGVLCGPAAPVCVPAGRIGGGVIGTKLGQEGADRMLKKYGPAAHNWDELKKDLANPMGDSTMYKAQDAGAEHQRVEANERAIELAGTRPGLSDVRRYLHAEPTNSQPAPQSWYPNAIPPTRPQPR